MGLVFCDAFEAPSRALRGLFQARRYSAFPAMSEPFTVYGALYCSGLEGTIELVCVQLETERTVFRNRTWATLAGGIVIHWMTRVERMVFPAPGRYSFKLMFDGMELTERYLDVAREKK